MGTFLVVQVKMPCSTCRGHEFDPGWGTETSTYHVGMGKKKKRIEWRDDIKQPQHPRHFLSAQEALATICNGTVVEVVTWLWWYLGPQKFQPSGRSSHKPLCQTLKQSRWQQPFSSSHSLLRSPLLPTDHWASLGRCSLSVSCWAGHWVPPGLQDLKVGPSSLCPQDQCMATPCLLRVQGSGREERKGQT